MAFVRKGSHYSCCVVSCKNTGMNSSCKFYSFPRAAHKVQQREKWIAAVQRANSGNASWFPKPSHLICSAHFINNKKSEEELSPSYVPTIFHNVIRAKAVEEKAAIQRHERFMQRRALKMKSMSRTTEKIAKEIKQELELENSDNIIINGIEDRLQIMMTEDAECQVNIYFDCTQSETTLVCNRYIYCDKIYCDCEIQTNIVNCHSPL